MKTVLVAEDEIGVRIGLEARLRKMGFQVVAVGNGQEAIRQIAEAVFNLVITDYTMPGASGCAVIEAARKKSEETKAVLMSARDDEGLPALAEKVGAHDFLRKPRDFERNGRLDEVVRRLLQS